MARAFNCPSSSLPPRRADRSNCRPIRSRSRRTRRARSRQSCSDAAGNLVKNQTVDFVLDDVTSGSLSVAQAVTNEPRPRPDLLQCDRHDERRRRRPYHRSVQGAPAVTDSANLTVAQRSCLSASEPATRFDESNTAQYTRNGSSKSRTPRAVGVSGADVLVQRAFRTLLGRHPNLSAGRQSVGDQRNAGWRLYRRGHRPRRRARPGRGLRTTTAGSRPATSPPRPRRLAAAAR